MQRIAVAGSAGKWRKIAVRVDVLRENSPEAIQQGSSLTLTLNTPLFVSMFHYKLPGILEAEDAIFAAMSFALQHAQTSTYTEKGGRAGRLLRLLKTELLLLKSGSDLGPQSLKHLLGALGIRAFGLKLKILVEVVHRSRRWNHFPRLIYRSFLK
jgi:hypothetical protein